MIYVELLLHILKKTSCTLNSIEQKASFESHKSGGQISVGIDQLPADYLCLGNFVLIATVGWCLLTAQEALLHQEVCKKNAVIGKLSLLFCTDEKLQGHVLLSPQIQIC